MKKLIREIHEQIHQQSFTKQDARKKTSSCTLDLHMEHRHICSKGSPFQSGILVTFLAHFPYERQFLFGLPLERLEQPQHLANVAWAVSAVSGMPEMGRWSPGEEGVGMCGYEPGWSKPEDDFIGLPMLVVLGCK